MKFKFKTQQYQVDAVDAVVNVFKGQPFKKSDEYTRDLGNYKGNYQRSLSFQYDDTGKIIDNNISFENFDDVDDIGFSNACIELDKSALLNNINNIQNISNLHESEVLDNSIGDVSLNVEMETGTGKTYVYTRTIFELNKAYGWSKFIIVVPSIAIREGVKKSFEQTQEHFMELYGKKIRFFVYSANNLGKIDNFSQSSSIYAMIINIQAFNRTFMEGQRESLIIYSIRDDFQGRRPIDVIAKNRPILILDEPQKMGGTATQNALRRFNPLFAINYSATHRVQHNLVYVLDALDAYNQKLVKKIEVKGFQIKNLRGTNGYLYLQKIQISNNKSPRALIELEINLNDSIKRETRWFDEGDNLYNTSKTNPLNQYKNGYVISEINPINNYVRFVNGDVLHVGNSAGDTSEIAIRRIQIRETILSHLEKEEEMYKKGIKVLSLFFIDEVKKYREYDDEGNALLGIYGKIFEEEYIKAINVKINLFDTPYNRYLKSINVKKTHNGYFSIDKKGRAIDSKLKRGSDESDDESAYDLILKDKERLLSFEEPVRFIFSHSALREGWDNPNVFQICTLKYSANDIQRHQEVGRGLRICVNKDGDRMDADTPHIRFHDINKLTIIANESYNDFVKGLQTQIKENLFDRPTSITSSYFVDKTIKLNNSDKTETISQAQANKIYYYLIQNNYIDVDGNVTDDYKNDDENKQLKPLPKELSKMTDGIHKLIKRVYDNSKGIEIEDARKARIENKLNANFNKKEFKELWNCINHKYAYTVQFDSNELIAKSVRAINANLFVSELIYTVQKGEQKNKMYKADVDSGTAFKSAQTYSSSIQTISNKNITYDLVGKIREKTNLTRKTVAQILKDIFGNKFNMFKVNPEEFIKKVANIINEQKASIIVEHVIYNKTNEEPFDSEIFNQDKTKADFLKAFKAKKNVQDYVFEDSSGEKKFAEELDNADEVVVYAKLPRGFYIPTPVGNYSPDWAIAFQKDFVQHVYFIAETKGSLDNMQLRKIEDAKIKCATKLFETMSDKKVRYGKVTNFNDLLNIIKGVS